LINLYKGGFSMQNAIVEQLEAMPTHATGKQLATIPTNKAAYTKPVLTTYGSVSQLTMGFGGSGTDGLGQMNPSDPRVKENIARVGQHPLGIGLYLFDYKPEFREEWGKQRQFGVMADEVETVLPAAVTRHTDGYKRVNYGLLGINRASN
jgi:hypothetical protein